VWPSANAQSRALSLPGAAQATAKGRKTIITVPQAFTTATVIREGDAGRKWIHALPGLVEDLCQHWNLRRDGPVMHGYLGLVIPVRRVEEPCVLKVS